MQGVFGRVLESEGVCVGRVVESVGCVCVGRMVESAGVCGRVVVSAACVIGG